MHVPSYQTILVHRKIPINTKTIEIDREHGELNENSGTQNGTIESMYFTMAAW
jgi:hypothetical protein